LGAAADRDATTGLTGSRRPNVLQDVQGPGIHGAVKPRGLAERLISRRLVASLQGVWNVVTGVWPIVHPASFVAVAGPKTDLWLVQTFGAYLATIGVVLLLGGRATPPPRGLAWLGMLSAAVLMVADLVFVSAGRMDRIYLADAAVELGWVLWWSVAGLGRNRTVEH